MNRIRKLLDPAFVRELFSREVLPQYPAFSAISRVEIKPYKELIWETTYHVVFRFNTFFLKPSGEEVKIPIFCSAHSNEPRVNVYRALQYLWEKGFPSVGIDLPDPLFYSEYFRGVFYRGLLGEDLLYYIQRHDAATVRTIVAKTAALFARLHDFPDGPQANFNPENARIRTVVPGVEKTKREMSARYQGRYDADLSLILERFISAEEANFASGRFAPVLIHGDAHPENIILTGPERVGLIDLTDLCLGDRARDVGSFLQQMEYKIRRKTGDAAYAEDMKSHFLSSYLAASGQALTPEFRARIDLYYNWTALRSAIFWFLKFGHNEERALELFNLVRANLHIS